MLTPAQARERIRENREALERENVAFAAMHAELLKHHKDKFALFKDGKPVDFFDTAAKAYDVGVEKFGQGAVFLIRRVVETEGEVWVPVSIPDY